MLFINSKHIILILAAKSKTISLFSDTTATARLNAINVKERLPYRVFDESAWDSPRIHDDGDDGDGDGGGDDDGDVLAEGVSSHFACTAIHRRTGK